MGERGGVGIKEAELGVTLWLSGVHNELGDLEVVDAPVLLLSRDHGIHALLACSGLGLMGAAIEVLEHRLHGLLLLLIKYQWQRLILWDVRTEAG